MWRGRGRAPGVGLMLGFRKRDVFDTLFGKGAERARAEFAPTPTAAAATTASVAAEVPHRHVTALSSWQYKTQDGEKYPGGFGVTQLLLADYWTLRARSAQLFEENLYARGLIRRLVDNVINVGLHLEAGPEERVLGFPEDGLAEWSEEVEVRFSLWAGEPRMCDVSERQTFGAMQATAYAEALISGDVLVVMVQDPRTKLPKLRLISGANVQTPFGQGLTPNKNGVRIVHGVELDAQNRQIAYHVRQQDGTSKRLPAWGEKSGRRLAWLVYGSDKRLDDVRGKPILALVLQSLKEIDRYRDATLRKAVIHSILALFIRKNEDKPGTRPMAASGVRKGSETVIDDSGQERTFQFSDLLPGTTIDELQTGEDIVPFNPNGSTSEFGTFEEAMVQTIAWSNGIPPEILRLTFSSNYSASQAATNEFKMALNPWRLSFGEAFCQPVYTDWLVSSVLVGKTIARGLLEAWRDFALIETFAAWIAADWTGQIKPAIDLGKLVTAAADAVEEGFTTRGRMSRELFGMKFSKVVQQLARENEALAKANKPLAELEASTKPKPTLPPGAKGPAKSDKPDSEDPPSGDEEPADDEPKAD